MSRDRSGYGFAGFWIRLLAGVVDGVVIGIIGYVVLGADIGMSDAFPDGVQRTAYGAAFGAPQAASHGTNFMLDWLYFAIFECSAWSATPGKKLLGLIVVDDEGRRISFLRATARYFAKFLSAVLLLLGFLCIGWNRRKRGLHDVIAGTLVLRRDSGMERIVPPDAVA